MQPARRVLERHLIGPGHRPSAPGSRVIGPIRIGARRSPLARAQADQVAASLAALGVPSEFVGITTAGDLDGRALTEIGGTGVFTSAVREALVGGRIDVAVHSLKDLPTASVPGLRLTAVPTREDTRDVLVGAGSPTSATGPGSGPALHAARSSWSSSGKVSESLSNRSRSAAMWTPG